MSSSNSSMDSFEVRGCGCAACHSSQPDLVSNIEAQNSGSSSSQNAPGPAADPQTFANYLTTGFWNDIGEQARSWSQNTVSYSISNSYTAAQKDGLRGAFDMWSDMADINFTEVSSGADITIVVGNDGSAHSSSNTSGTSITSNVISIDTSAPWWRDIGDLGDYATTTALHEIAHSLGLGHSGNYNGSATYSQDAQFANDSRQYTIQSYFNASETGADHFDSNGQAVYGATPLLIDILAIQNIYGANTTTRLGDTTYGFNSTADRDAYDFTLSEAPLAIWDAGGVDTIDLSGYSTTNTLYLTEGDFSSVGYLSNNLAIAYGTVIENAIGGSGIDTIYGNDANNVILGGAGADTLYGSLGNDTLDGQDGNDTAVYNYIVDDFAFNFINNISFSITHLIEGFTDVLSNIESFIFGGTSFSKTELENDYAAEQFATRFDWAGGTYDYSTTTTENYTFNAGDAGLSHRAAGVNLAAIDRAGTTLDVEILDNAMDGVLLRGGSRDETLSVTGTDNNIVVRVYAGEGDDTIIVSGVIGNDRLNGEGGNDTISAGAGADYLFGGAGDDVLNGEAGVDRLNGDEGNDTLNGGTQTDYLYGGEGNDILNGGDGNDVMWGGIGADSFDGGNGNDRGYGEAGDDSFVGGAGNDRFYGGDGNDNFDGGIGQDFLYGDAGIDTINGGDQADFLYGGDGDDTINGGNHNDRIFGGNDNDTLNGEAGADVIHGEAGDDVINGGNGFDILNGGLGADTIHGGTGNDTLRGNEGNDILDGEAGNDRLYGGDGQDTLTGGLGQDFLYGEDGNDILNGGDLADRLEGGAGIDTLRGDAGNDRLYGDTGSDTLYGGTGRDFLYGGADADTLYGEGGNDVFVFESASAYGAVDVLGDFTLGDNDQLDISDLLSGFIDGVSDISQFVQFTTSGSDSILSVDADGLGIGSSFVDIAHINGGAGLDANTLLANNAFILS